MFRLAILFLFIHLGLFSQRKIYTIGNAQGVVFSSKDYSEKNTLACAKKVENIFQKKYGAEFKDFVRQYSIIKLDEKEFFFVFLIPIEKAYEYKWRYEEYHGRSRLVRVVFYDIQAGKLSDVSWANIDE